MATHKAQILSRYTDRATVIAPQVTEALRKLPFRIVEKPFEATDLEGVTLLFVCTGNHELNHEIREMAHNRHILTSVCDDPEACDFISPAIHREGNLTIAVASDGKDVKRSIRVRNEIKEGIENDRIRID